MQVKQLQRTTTESYRYETCRRTNPVSGGDGRSEENIRSGGSEQRTVMETAGGRGDGMRIKRCCGNDDSAGDYAIVAEMSTIVVVGMHCSHRHVHAHVNIHAHIHVHAYIDMMMVVIHRHGLRLLHLRTTVEHSASYCLPAEDE